MFAIRVLDGERVAQRREAFGVRVDERLLCRPQAGERRVFGLGRRGHGCSPQAKSGAMPGSDATVALVIGKRAGGERAGGRRLAAEATQPGRSIGFQPVDGLEDLGGRGVVGGFGACRPQRQGQRREQRRLQQRPPLAHQWNPSARLAVCSECFVPSMPT